MEFIAVASINRGESVVGARILSVEDLHTYDYTIEHIECRISGGTTIRNITLEKGKAHWSQGVVSRYPILDADSMNVINNINSIIVLGSYENDSNKTEYIVANCYGKVVQLDEERLIEYGKQHTLANCKIYTKDNKLHIASLSGEIDKLLGEAEFSYNDINRSIIVKLPFMGCSKLVIPQLISGLKVTNPTGIQIKSKRLASGITHLVLPASLTTLRSNMFQDLHNLRVLESNAYPEYIHSEVFSWCRGLTDVYLGGIKGKANKLFGGLTHLKNITFRSRPTTIQISTFEDCISAPMNDMIYEGLSSIGEKAFDGCIQLENVELPKSLKRIGSSAFKNCGNIKSLTITNSNLIIDGDWDRTKGNSKEKSGFINIKLLADSPNAILYCPHSFPESIIKEHISEHVRIIRSEPTEDDKNLLAKQAKALMLGIKIREADVAKDAKEVLGFLTLINDIEWRDSLLNCIRDKLNDQLNNEEIYNIECKGAHIQISLGHMSYWRRAVKYIKQSKVGKNYMYITKKGEIIVYLIDRLMIKEHISDRMSRDKKRGGEKDSRYVLEIPSESRYIVSEGVSKIYEKDNGLVVEYKNGALEEIIVR